MHNLIKAFFILKFLFCSAAPLAADNSHCLLDDPNGPWPVARYEITDLGATSLTAEQLTRLEPLYSLAPSINNLGQVVYNKENGGYVRDPNIGEYALGVPDLTIFGHAINDHGDVLVSLLRQDKDIEWMVWNKKSALNCPQGKKAHAGEGRFHIAHLNEEQRAFFCAIGNSGIVIGYREYSQKLWPLVWFSSHGVRRLGSASGYDLIGFPRGVNAVGTIVGYFEEPEDSPPMVWMPGQGLEVFRNYRQVFENQGWIELADLVIASDNTVYGTYLLKYVSQQAGSENVGHYFLYRWLPCRNEASQIGVKDLRITSVNNSKTLAGSQNGRAVIYNEGRQIIDLNRQLTESAGRWRLFEATGINDMGQIVGYGMYNEEMHLFLLQPTP